MQLLRCWPSGLKFATDFAVHVLAQQRIAVAIHMRRHRGLFRRGEVPQQSRRVNLRRIDHLPRQFDSAGNRSRQQKYHRYFPCHIISLLYHSQPGKSSDV